MARLDGITNIFYELIVYASIGQATCDCAGNGADGQSQPGYKK